MTARTWPAPVTLREFDETFEAVKNWGRWGSDDELGTLNFITPETVRAAAGLVRAVTDGSPSPDLLFHRCHSCTEAASSARHH